MVRGYEAAGNAPPLAARGRAGLRFPGPTGYPSRVALRNRLYGAPVGRVSARSAPKSTSQVSTAPSLSLMTAWWLQP